MDLEERVEYVRSPPPAEVSGCITTLGGGAAILQRSCDVCLYRFTLRLPGGQRKKLLLDHPSLHQLEGRRWKMKVLRCAINRMINCMYIVFTCSLLSVTTILRPMIQQL